MNNRIILSRIVAGIAALILVIGMIGGAGIAKMPGAAVTTRAADDAEDDASTFPSSFDLRNVDTDGDGIGDTCYVTSVKHQRPFGTCWGFAAIAAAETSILADMAPDTEAKAIKTLNLSEKQLTYFARVAINDENNPQNGEGTYTTVTEPKSDDIYNVGGTPFLAASSFATGVGPTSEDRKDTNGTFVYKGVPGNIATKKDAAGKDYDFCYSAEDDWSLDEEYRFLSDYVLREAYFLPSPAQYVEDESAEELIPGVPASKYEYDPSATEIFKDMIMNHHYGIIIGFLADTSRPWEDPSGKDGNYMSTKYWSHYTWQPMSANHAVLIVGWDDNYPKENFIEGHQPPEDGAWLVKNSWGAGTEKFPDRGTGTWGIQVPLTDENGNEVKDENGETVMVGSGYFWLSYYDQSLNNPEVLMFDTWLTGIGTKYEHSTLKRGQYDLMPVSTLYGAQFDDEVKMANIFTPETDVHIPCISYQAGLADTTLTYEVYLLNEGYTSPTDGVLLASNTKHYDFAGYYMDYLTSDDPDDPVIIQKGQSYSIVVTQVVDDGTYAVSLPVSTGENNIMITLGMTNVYSKAVVNEGESFFYHDGGWEDWSDPDLRSGMLDEPLMEDVDPQLDNFPMKAFTFTEPMDISVALENDEKEVTVKVGDDPRTLKLEFSGSQADILWKDPDITWEVYDGSGELFTMTPAADGKSVVLKGLAPGKAKVYAHVADVGTVLFTVTVLKADETKPDVPNTGDHNSSYLWMCLLAISVLAMVVVVTARTRKNNSN